MDQVLANALETPERLKMLPTLPDGKVLHFAFAPEDAILMLHRSTELNRARLTQAVQKAGRQVGKLCDTVWAGEVWWAADHPIFRVSLKRSVGEPLNVKRFRTALMAMARELKGFGLLRDPEIVRQTEKVMSAAELRQEGGKESWRARLGRGSTYHRVLDELEALDKARSNEERRASLNTILRRIKVWFEKHEEDIGEGGDKALRAQALQSLRAQVVDELARTLDEGRMKPDQLERDLALASLNDSVGEARKAPSLSSYTAAATRIERWAALGVRPDELSTLEVGMGLARELEERPTSATPSSLKAAARFVRSVRLDLLRAGNARERLDLVHTQLDALQALQGAVRKVRNTREGGGEDWGETQEVAERELIKLERDLSAIRQELRLQEAIEQDQGRVRFTGGEKPAGASGSYFVGDGERPRAVVFKPFSQEVVQSTEAQAPGEAGRGEVLAARVGELLGQHLGISVNAPKTEVGVLTGDRLSQFQVRDDRDPSVATSTQQIGTMQQFVPTSEGELGACRVYHIEEFGVTISAGAVGAEILLEELELKLRDQPELAWHQLNRDTKLKLIDQKFARKENLRWVYPPGVDVDELGRGLDNVAILDLFTLQTDRNPGNVLMDVYRDENQVEHTRVVPIDQALCMPSLRAAASEFKGFTSLEMKSAFKAWIDTAGHDRPLQAQVVERIVNLDVDELVGELERESEQFSESTGGQVKGLTLDQVQIQRLSMRCVQHALKQRPGLSRRQLANLILDYDGIPWRQGQKRGSPFGQAMLRLVQLKMDRALLIMGIPREELDSDMKALMEKVAYREQLLSLADFEEEWTERLRPSVDLWLEALPK